MWWWIRPDLTRMFAPPFSSSGFAYWLHIHDETLPVCHQSPSGLSRWLLNGEVLGSVLSSERKKRILELSATGRTDSFYRLRPRPRVTLPVPESDCLAVSPTQESDYLTYWLLHYPREYTLTYPFKVFTELFLPLPPSYIPPIYIIFLIIFFKFKENYIEFI